MIGDNRLRSVPMHPPNRPVFGYYIIQLSLSGPANIIGLTKVDMMRCSLPIPAGVGYPAGERVKFLSISSPSLYLTLDIFLENAVPACTAALSLPSIQSFIELVSESVL
jgi:hypothetical protein